MPIQCDIITQERTVFSGEVDSVNIPGSEGRMGILPKHTALLTTLDFGEVIVRTGGLEEYFAIGGGFAEVQPDHVTILADSAEHADEIDLERAERARERAQKLIAEGVPEDPEIYAQIRASLLRAQARLDVSRRRRIRAMPTGRSPHENEV
ncbi:MAG: F0F1 ATP synthase subunit epsilon [Candidatus Promineifilaceae bacterium]|jgi:F-type H+-transporting ATPase subunit epsilon